MSLDVRKDTFFLSVIFVWVVDSDDNNFLIPSENYRMTTDELSI